MLTMERGQGNRFSLRRRLTDKKSARLMDASVRSQSLEFESHKLSYISLKEANELDKELLNDFAFSIEQLMEVAGLSCSLAIAKNYPREALTKSKGEILVVCGPFFSGGLGLVCAKYLKIFSYRPTIFCPKRLDDPVHQRLSVQCERLHIPFLSYMPSEAGLLTTSYNVIVDALLGSSSTLPPPLEFNGVIQTMLKSGLPVVSIDVPSGWDAEKEDPNGLHPDLLISLIAPKLCAASFKGRAHFLVGRYVPLDLIRKYQLILPDYFGTEMFVDLTYFCRPMDDGCAQ